MEKSGEQKVSLLQGRPIVYSADSVNPFVENAQLGKNELILDEPELRRLAGVLILDQDITEVANLGKRNVGTK